LKYEHEKKDCESAKTKAQNLRFKRRVKKSASGFRPGAQNRKHEDKKKTVPSSVHNFKEYFLYKQHNPVYGPGAPQLYFFAH
jgi:hypothetical protein